MPVSENSKKQKNVEDQVMTLNKRVSEVLVDASCLRLVLLP